MDYKILTAESPTELEEAVKQHLSAGWHLVGGVATSHPTGMGYTNQCLQAVFKPAT